MWGGSGRGGASNLTGADRGRMWIGAVSPASSSSKLLERALELGALLLLHYSYSSRKSQTWQSIRLQDLHSMYVSEVVYGKHSVSKLTIC